MVERGQKRDFLELLERHQDILHKICGIYAANEEDRKDLSQEIVCQLWQSYPSFRGDSKFTTWMYRIALNTALLDLRRNRRRGRTQPIEAHHEHIAVEADDPERQEQIRGLYAAIHTLQGFDRAVILLFLERLSYREIADITGLSEANVSVRLVRIKSKLRKLLNKGP